ncbi:MAG: hypothetical protein OEW05_02885 [Candidatus Aminicenantes bacterium]|nr:hypothetical protein [Candidatus Aminicenantes bacterium]
MVKIPKSTWGPVLALGAVWGVAEAGLGMGLRQCAAQISGALMTGVALFFLAAGRRLVRRATAVVVMVGTAAVFKLFDALLLGLPVRHGAIANPIFAFVVEGAAFLAVIALFRKELAEKHAGRGLLGGLTALIAVNVFPLVKFATGIPACVVPGTAYPLSLYYAPIAIGVSLFTVPLGWLAGERLAAWTSSWGAVRPARLRWVTSAAVAASIAAVVLLRAL